MKLRKYIHLYLASFLLALSWMSSGCGTARNERVQIQENASRTHPLAGFERPIELARQKYRGTTTRSVTGLETSQVGDLNRDGLVDDLDVELWYAVLWTQSDGNGDINDDGEVNELDVELLTDHWGICEGVCPGDLNEDMKIDDTDLMLMSWAYAVERGIEADLNGDTVIDVKDLVILLVNQDALEEVSSIEIHEESKSGRRSEKELTKSEVPAELAWSGDAALSLPSTQAYSKMAPVNGPLEPLQVLKAKSAPAQDIKAHPEVSVDPPPMKQDSIKSIQRIVQKKEESVFELQDQENSGSLTSLDPDRLEKKEVAILDRFYKGSEKQGDKEQSLRPTDLSGLSLKEEKSVLKLPEGSKGEFLKGLDPELPTDTTSELRNQTSSPALVLKNVLSEGEQLSKPLVVSQKLDPHLGKGNYTDTDKFLFDALLSAGDRQIDKIFKSRTVDGNLQLSKHENRFTKKSDGSISDVASGDTVGLTDTEFQTILQDQMGLAFAITSYSNDGSKDIDDINSYADRHRDAPNRMLITHSLQIDPAYHLKKVGVFLYSQKHFPVNGHAERVIEHQDSGLSVFQLVYGNESFNSSAEERLGAGCYQDFPSGNGLTDLGRQVVRQLIDNYMIIDVSHCHTDTISDVVVMVNEAATSRGQIPVMANHTVARTIATAHGGGSPSRGLTDENIRNIALTGGVIGICPLNHFLVDDKSRDNLIDIYVDHIEHVIEQVETVGLIGTEHVGFSSDAYANGIPHDAPVFENDGTNSGTTYTSMWTLGKDLNQFNRWKQVIQYLANKKVWNRDGYRYKYSDQDLRSIAGENFIRVFRRAMPGYDRPQIANITRVSLGGSIEYVFDWESVRINETLNFRFPLPKYIVTVYGRMDDGYEKVFTSNASSESYLRLLSDQIDATHYSKFRGYIRAINPDNSSGEYVNSKWFFFDRD